MSKCLVFLLICSIPKKAWRYLSSQEDADLDLFLYSAFVVQTFALVAVPSDHNLSIQTQWGRYAVWVIFYLLFYPFYYFKYYKNNKNFIRDIVILSVSARVLAFLITGITALICAYLKSKFRLVFSSIYIFDMTVVFQAIYYVFFSFFMIKVRK